jgi:hypothetical protein
MAQTQVSVSGGKCTNGTRWPADRTGAMAAAADIVGEEHFAVAPPVLGPVAGFDFDGAESTITS